MCRGQSRTELQCTFLLNGDGVSLFAPVKDGFEMEELDAKEERKTAAQATKEGTVTPIPENFFIELDEGPYSDAKALEEAFTPQELAHELRRRGLKAGGSHHERAQRLFLVKGMADRGNRSEAQEESQNKVKAAVVMYSIVFLYIVMQSYL